jgi:hypothetical protein
MPNDRSLVARLAVLAGAAVAAAAVAQPPDPAEFRRRLEGATAAFEGRGLAAPFAGITADGAVEPSLYSIRSTGVSTEPVVAAARAFLAALSTEERGRTLFAVDDPEWRKWANMHLYARQGVSFEELGEGARAAARGLLGAALSAKGLKLSEDIMRLNQTLGELNGDNFVEYGEGKYWLSVMGEPSATEPWGFQLDGHHLIVNYFVLGDQVVMTPAFWGSEPAVATSGKYAGTAILQDEQAAGLAMLRSLTEQQRARAVVKPAKTGNDIRTQAFSDNVVLPYEGVPVSAFTAAQRRQLLDLVQLFVGNLREGHARVHMAEVEARLDDTYFAWIGETRDDSAYYYRIHSPVLLVEFDHQTPVGLRHLYPPGVPNRDHIHAVVRTPNGNDYGKDLLRQHLERHPH